MKIIQKGNFNKTEKFLESAKKINPRSMLEEYGKRGVAVLSSATPVDSGKTADSWSYKVICKNGKYSVEWINDNKKDNVPIAIILQYGHATKNGGWVQGKDYINPAIKPIFDDMAKTIWTEMVGR